MERPSALRHGAVFLVFVLLAAWYTHPLLPLSDSHIAGEPPVDPLLNASVLWWNATTVPLTGAWWNAPHYYPSQGITAFTENLLGIYPIATPIYWLTGNPLTAYNLSLFLSWPLSAFNAYLLAWVLMRRADAAFIAGLAYGFSVYRTAELGHIQMVSSYWIPVALLALHQYLRDRRRRWLVLFGGAWLLQSLANLYLMLFSLVLIALWLLYFWSGRAAAPHRWRSLALILGVWIIAALPLAPILIGYRDIHEHYGLERALREPLGYSNHIRTWFAVSGAVRFWSRALPDDHVNHFPGLTVMLLVTAGVIVTLARARTDWPRLDRRRLRLMIALAAATVIAVATIVFTMFAGGWETAVAGITVRVHDLGRAAGIALLCGGALVLLARRTREAIERRSPLVFYAFATVAMAIFALGPVIPANGQVLFEPAPYRFLMALPGFDGLRIPARFWMLGVLCLAMAAGFAYHALTHRARRLRPIVFTATAIGMLLDAWTWGFLMVPAQPSRLVLERPGPAQAIVELPIGEGTADAWATFRSMGHRRRVANGVSGYDPPHYLPLVEGLLTMDRGMLEALASLGSFDVVIDTSTHAAWAPYVMAMPGATVLGTEGTRTALRLPSIPLSEPEPGAPLPIAQVTAIDGHPSRAIDGSRTVIWDDGPQRPGQWFLADLGSTREVSGVTTWLGGYARDFPRHLAIDLSIDAADWTTVWEGRDRLEVVPRGGARAARDAAPLRIRRAPGAVRPAAADWERRRSYGRLRSWKFTVDREGPGRPGPYDRRVRSADL